MSHLHTTPWDPALDTAFFRIVNRLFSPALVEGAGALLASYDDDVPLSPRVPAPRAALAAGRVRVTRRAGQPLDLDA